MDSTTVYIKTLQGHEEIRRRSQPLSMRERALLIMIDGHRTLHEIQALNAASVDVGAHLKILLDAGLIAAIPKPAEAPPPSKPKPFALSQEDLDKIKKYMNTVLYEALGPDSDSFSLKIENLKTAADILKMALDVRDVIASIGKSKLSNQFWTNVREMLPGE